MLGNEETDSWEEEVSVAARRVGTGQRSFKVKGWLTGVEDKEIVRFFLHPWVLG